MNKLNTCQTGLRHYISIFDHHINCSHGQIFQLTVDGVITETGRSVQQTVEEDLRQELEPVQTLFRQTEEQSVRETTPSLELATRRVVR